MALYLSIIDGLLIKLLIKISQNAGVYYMSLLRKVCIFEYFNDRNEIFSPFSIKKNITYGFSNM